MLFSVLALLPVLTFHHLLCLCPLCLGAIVFIVHLFRNAGLLFVVMVLKYLVDNSFEDVGVLVQLKVQGILLSCIARRCHSLYKVSNILMTDPQREVLQQNTDVVFKRLRKRSDFEMLWLIVLKLLCFFVEFMAVFPDAVQRPPSTHHLEVVSRMIKHFSVEKVHKSLFLVV